MSKQSLLLVDGDPRSLRVLEVSLKKAGFNVTTAVTGTDASEKIALALPDLILSETRLDGIDGFDLCQRLKANVAWAGIPFVFLTAQTEIEHKIKGLELGCDDYLTKPIYIKEIVTRVRILLQKQQRSRIEQKREGRTRFAGRLSDMAVVDLIQTIELSRKSGVIQFHGQGEDASGPPIMAVIYFRDGKLIDGEMGALQGEDAVYRLLTWNDGEFEVVFRTVRRRDVIEMNTQALLMEGMRRLDEWGRLLEQLPNLHARFEVDVKELASRLGEIPDEHNSILKLFDGRRTLMDVIDASGYGDLETLEVIAKLYFEGLLFEVSPPPPRAKTPTEEWYPQKMLEATPAELGAVGVADSGPHGSDSGPTGASGDAIPQTVDSDDEPSERQASGKASQLAPKTGGPPTSLIFDENFAGEDATPLPGPMVEAVDDLSGPHKVVESRGADTATAFGEVESGERSLGENTQRELVTIQPRRGSRGDTPAIDEDEDDAFSEISERVTGEVPVPRILEIGELNAEAARAARPTPPVIDTRPVTVPPPPPPPRGGRAAAHEPDDHELPPRRSLTGPVVAAAIGIGAILILWLALRGKSGPERAGAETDRRARVDARTLLDDGDSTLDGTPTPVVAPDATPVVAPDAAAEAPPDAAVDKKQLARQLVRKAKSKLSDGYPDAALEIIDEALKTRETAEAYVVQADILRRLKRTTEAVEATELAIRKNSRYAPAWKMKGNILSGAGRFEEARPAFERFLELAPDDPDAESIRARLEGG